MMHGPVIPSISLKKPFALVLALGLAGAPASAAECMKPAEAVAEHVRILQTELMVGALKCARRPQLALRAKYNAFVQAYTPQLIGYSEVLKGYFMRQHGPAFRPHMDRHITALANAVSRQSTAMDDYCERIASVGEALLAHVDTAPAADATAQLAQTPSVTRQVIARCPAPDQASQQISQTSAQTTVTEK